MQKPYLEAGKIVNTHGVRGEVRIQPWADDAAFLLGFRTFYIDGAPVPVAHSRVHKGMLVVKFAEARRHLYPGMEYRLLLQELQHPQI